MATSPSDHAVAASPGHERSVPTRFSVGRLPAVIVWRSAVRCGLEAILLGVVAFQGLLLLDHRVAAGASHALVLAVTAAGAHLYLRQVMALSVWVSLGGVLLFGCHPLCIAATTPAAPLGRILPFLMAPWLLLLCHYGAIARNRKTAVGVAVSVGLLSGVCVPVGALYVLLAAACLAIEFAAAGRRVSVGKRLRRSALIAVISISIGVLTSALVSELIPGFSAAQALDAQGLASAPFAWVDRGGVLSSWLERMPADLIAGGGAHYFGCGLIALCLIAVWPNVRDDGKGRVAGLIVLGMFFAWLTLGEDLHSQLRRMFEFATVRLRIDTPTLHLLGAMVLPLAALGLLVFLSAANLVSRRPRWTLPAVVLASAAAMLWWRTTPTDVSAAVANWLALEQSLIVLETLIAFTLICAACSGIRRLWSYPRTLRTKVLSAAIVAIVLVADVLPYAQSVWMPLEEPIEEKTTTFQPASG